MCRARAGGGPLLRDTEPVGIHQHLRQVGSHVRLPGELDVAHRRLQEALQTDLQRFGRAEPVQVVAEGLAIVQFGEPAIAGEAELLGLAENVAEQLLDGPNGPRRQETQGPGRRKIPDEIGGREARRRCGPPTVPIPAELHRRAYQRHAQFLADSERHVVGGTEEVRTLVHEEAVDLVAGQASPGPVICLKQDRLDTTLLEGPSGSQSGRSPADYDDSACL